MLSIIKHSEDGDIVMRACDRPFLHVLIEWYKKHELEVKLSAGTIKQYQGRLKNITEFFEKTGRLNMSISEVRPKDMEEFRDWQLKKFRSCSRRHASRNIEVCKKVTAYALLMEYTNADYLRPIKIQRDKWKEVVHLEVNEYQKLKAATFHKRLLQIAADVYIFQCATGLSYADLKTFNIIEKDGKAWLSNCRQKSKEVYNVPLFPDALAILQKYQRNIPIPSNQVLNVRLKVIAELLGINKNLTSHTARKTFATHRDQEGFSPKTIADMMGNTVKVLEQHYLRKSSKRTEKELVTLGYFEEVTPIVKTQVIRKQPPDPGARSIELCFLQNVSPGKPEILSA